MKMQRKKENENCVPLIILKNEEENIRKKIRTLKHNIYVFQTVSENVTQMLPCFLY